MKLYIAGKFGDKNKINKYIKEATLLGYDITHNWTKFETNNNKIQSAIKDLQGVMECNCLVCIMDDSSYAYRGTFTEIGAGLALNKKIIIVNPHTNSYCTSNVFYHHPSIIHVNSWNNALEMLSKVDPL